MNIIIIIIYVSRNLIIQSIMIGNPKLFLKVTPRICSKHGSDPLWLVLGPLIHQMTPSLWWLEHLTSSKNKYICIGVLHNTPQTRWGDLCIPKYEGLLKADPLSDNPLPFGCC